MSKFTTGITVATTLDASKNSVGITINSFCSISLEPMLIMFSLVKSSSLHATFLQNKEFCINILSEHQVDICKTFASPSTADWSKIKHHKTQNTKCSIIDNSIAFVDCKIHTTYDGGDHTIIIGKVIDLGLLEDAPPLTYFGGKFYKKGNIVDV